MIKSYFVRWKNLETGKSDCTPVDIEVRDYYKASHIINQISKVLVQENLIHVSKIELLSINLL